MGPRTDEDARDASSIYIRTAFLNSSQNHGPYPNTGIICFCLCYIDHVFSRFYFSLCDGNTRVCTRFSLFTPYRTCIKSMLQLKYLFWNISNLVPHLVPHLGHLGHLYQKCPTLGYLECDLISPYLVLLNFNFTMLN